MINQFSGDYRFLSNFYPSIITAYDITYPSVEHAFQAQKVMDPDVQRRIAALWTASDAKRAGRELSLREDWDQVKDQIMLDLLRLKFNITILGMKLVNTRPHELIEGNTWHDVYWGRCRCAEHQGQGQNKLGQLLMQVREELHKANPWAFDCNLP